jgi:hypothetical protein
MGILIQVNKPRFLFLEAVSRALGIKESSIGKKSY